MSGKITRVAVTYTMDTPDGPRHTFHGLPHMRQHIPPGQLSDLMDNLTAICELLVASRVPTPWDRAGRIAEEGPVTSEEATALFHLRCLWQNSYMITFSDGAWTARRHYNPAKVLTAGNAPDLRWAIRTDYGEWLRTRP
jgi:hypothetical protein